MLTHIEGMPDLAPAVELIRRQRHTVTAHRAILVALSGIDGSGKGFVAARLERQLERAGLRVAVIGIDPWQHPQTIRLSRERPAAHFYEHAFRWDELFLELVAPLVHERSADLMVNAIRTDVDRFFPRQYRFDDVDVVLLEGIFLFKRELNRRYDLRLWITCSFETALVRAHLRNQEGLSPRELERDFRSIYFPAQRLHFERDNPVGNADLLISNDPAEAVRPMGERCKVNAVEQLTC